MKENKEFLQSIFRVQKHFKHFDINTKLSLMDLLERIFISEWYWKSFFYSFALFDFFMQKIDWEISCFWARSIYKKKSFFKL